MTVDSIDLNITIDAPIEQVWTVLTQSQFLGAWFGNGAPASVDLRPGGLILFDHGVHGSLPARIERVEPPNLLSYRWSQGKAGEEPRDGNATLVELTLRQEGSGTRLRVVESGFNSLSLPSGDIAERLTQNSLNWPGKLDFVREYTGRLLA